MRLEYSKPWPGGPSGLARISRTQFVDSVMPSPVASLMPSRPGGNPASMVRTWRNVVARTAGDITSTSSGSSCASVSSTPPMSPSPMAIPISVETTLFVTDATCQ